jgi:monofunctional glycosyltransferase
MPIRPGTLKLPTLRNALTRIHADLLTIDRRITWVDRDEQLSVIEKFVLILEDRKFFHHNGFHFKACYREMMKALLILTTRRSKHN